MALQQGHDKVVALLLENDSGGKIHLPALHIAAKKNDTKAATLLLQNAHNADKASDKVIHLWGGSVAEWLACWTQAQKAWVQIAAATLSGNSLRQTVHTIVPLFTKHKTGSSPLKGCGDNCGPGGK